MTTSPGMTTAAPAMMFGPYGRRALQHADRFAELDADTAWFHGFDDEAFEVCDRFGIAACVEFPTFRGDYDAHPDLVPIGTDGRPIRRGELMQGVCLSQTTFLAEVEQRLTDGLRSHRPAGIWLDYLSGAGWFESAAPDLQQSCFCGLCVTDFCTTTGIDATTPEQILGQHVDAWTEHACQRIAGFAAHYAALIHAQLPDCVIGAYLCPWTPGEHGGALRTIFAQDYALLAPSVEVFTPLIYGTKSGRPPRWGRDFLEAAPDFVPHPRRTQLIMDALDGPDAIDAAVGAAQPSWGLQVFGGAQLWTDSELGAAFAAAVETIRAAQAHRNQSG